MKKEKTEKVEINDSEKIELENKKGVKKGKSKLKSISVIMITILLLLFALIYFRGMYLETIDAGLQYEGIYAMKVKEIIAIYSASFLISFFSIYITTKKLKSNINELFDEESKKMPNLPNKSIAFIISVIIALVFTSMLKGEFLKIANMTWFGKKDIIFGLDYSIGIFVVPVLEKLIMFSIIMQVINLIYMVIYDVVIINTKLNGIDFQEIKNKKSMKQIFNAVLWVITTLVAYMILKLGKIQVTDMMRIGSKVPFYLTGASYIDIKIKVFGRVILAFLIIFSMFRFKKGILRDDKKLITKSLLTVPVYIVILYGIIGITKTLWINKNEIQYEGEYIKQNMYETKNGYNINTQEIIIDEAETLTSDLLIKNQDIINEIPILDKDLLGKILNKKEEKVYNDTYIYNQSQLMKLHEGLVYFSPREINNKKNRSIYEYTHGNYGAKVKANNLNINGDFEILDKSFKNQIINNKTIKQPRIYYGLETNKPAVVKTKDTKEFDYYITPSKIAKNTYDGAGGLKLGFIDRFVLGLRNINNSVLFINKQKEDTKILFNRNIISRAKKIVPELRYDENAYMVFTNEGRMMWVIDAYVYTDRYPYSQTIKVPTADRSLKKINYIRNVAKVLVDAYDGTVTYYLMDKNEPLGLNLSKIYKGVFKDFDEIPSSIKAQLKYPKILYDIQSELLTKYHTNSKDLFYSGEDVWEIANADSENGQVGKRDLKEKVFKNIDEDKTSIGYLTTYVPFKRQNISSYLVGKTNNGRPELKMYMYTNNYNIPTIKYIKKQIDEEESIRDEINNINKIGTEVVSYPMLIPINKSMIYVEPVFQIQLNNEYKTTLKKVIVANGNKVGIGNNLKSAITNLFSDIAINIDIHDPLNREILIEAIIRANNALEKSMGISDLEAIGRNTKKINALIKQLEKLDEKTRKDEEKEKQKHKEDKSKVKSWRNDGEKTK